MMRTNSIFQTRLAPDAIGNRGRRRSFLNAVLCVALGVTPVSVTALRGADETASAVVRSGSLLRLSLDDCVREALIANHALLARTNERDAAEARRTAAAAARRPRLGLQGAAQHSTDPMRVRAATYNGELGAFSRDIWQVSIGAAMPLYAGGRLRAEEDAARFLAEAAQGDLNHARQGLAVRIVSLYEDALALRSVIVSLNQSRATLVAQTERIEALLRQQKAADVDRLRVSVRLARVEQYEIETRSRLEVVQATLAVLMARDPMAPWELSGELVPLSVPNTNSLPAFADRGDEAAAQARASAAERQVRAAQGAWLPSLDAVAGLGPRSDFDGQARYEAGFAGLQVSWNIWDIGRTSSKVAEARSLARARHELSTETSLQRRLEFTAADSAVRSAVARIEASRLAVEQARESLRIEQRKYDLGQGAIVDVLDAQSAAVETESLRARALADHAVALATRDFATGRIFTTEAGLPALRSDPAATSASSSTLAHP